MGSISSITLPNNSTWDIRAAAIPYGECDSSSTSSLYTATVTGITSLHDGVCVLLRNNVVTSASGFSININSLGAKPVYDNMSANTQSSAVFYTDYTALFIYCSWLNSGSGGWHLYRGDIMPYPVTSVNGQTGVITISIPMNAWNGGSY